MVVTHLPSLSFPAELPAGRDTLAHFSGKEMNWEGNDWENHPPVC